MDRSTLSGNTAAEGGGIYLSGGSRLTASACQLGGNRLASASNSLAARRTAGADLAAADGQGNSVAYLEPLPAEGELAGGQGRAGC